MFCIKCGEKLEDTAVFCSQCGEKVGNSQVNHQNEELEEVLMSGLCNRVKNILFVQNGKAMLTNKRFIYLKHSLAKIAAIGVLVNLTEGSYDFDIPLNEIQSIEDGRQGLSKTIIINTKKGEKYNFYVTKREEWKIKLQSAIQKAQSNI